MRTAVSERKKKSLSDSFGEPAWVHSVICPSLRLRAAR